MSECKWSVFGIGSMGTVDELKSNGAKHLKLDDGDFTRFS